MANCKAKIATGERESKKILVRISSDTNIQMKELVESSSGWNGGKSPRTERRIRLESMRMSYGTGFALYLSSGQYERKNGMNYMVTISILTLAVSGSPSWAYGSPETFGDAPDRFL